MTVAAGAVAVLALLELLWSGSWSRSRSWVEVGVEVEVTALLFDGGRLRMVARRG